MKSTRFPKTFKKNFHHFVLSSAVTQGYFRRFYVKANRWDDAIQAVYKSYGLVGYDVV